MSLIIGMMTLPLLAVFSFEVARLYLAKQQLQNASDAAVLAATATLASSDNTNPTQAHNNAIQAAVTIFQQNTVLGNQLTNSTTVGSANVSAPPGQADLFFQFIDPVTKNFVPISSPLGKIVNLTSGYDTYLAFGKYLGITDFEVTAISKGAVPILDLEVCFDVSGSMDDQTPVSFVKRSWDASLGKITYNLPIGPTNGKAQGTIYNILQPPAVGTSLNGTFPQLLEETSNSLYGNPLTFTGDAGSNMRSLNGYPEQGSPPGDYPPGPPDPFAGQNTYYTDVVVNLDGNAQFGSKVVNTNQGSFSFPDLATLVEAARGNLENNQVFQSSKANTSVSVQPKAGYQAAYFAGVNPQLQPITSSQSATLMFADIMNTDTDCHFGLVTFDDVIGTNGSPGVVSSGGNMCEQWINIDQNIPYGQLLNYPLPLIQLNQALGVTNYNQFVSGIQSTVAMGGTNIGAAVDQAVKDLKANGRPGSVKAIVLFTDGEPTLGQPLNNDPQLNARMAAQEANVAGIPVYTIGLAQVPAIEPGEIAILNDTNNNPATGGIAAIAAHGGTFNLVTNQASLRTAFEKIARRLVELVANSSGDY